MCSYFIYSLLFIDKVRDLCGIYSQLNFRLIHLFEGGILEKMTNAEYEKMINSRKTDVNEKIPVGSSSDNQNLVQHV